MTERPFSRNPSRTILVSGEFAGRPMVYEVRTDEWLSKKTDRYHRMWHVRQKGSLGWHAASTPRLAFLGAACVHKGRPRWVATAVAEATERLRAA